jgi:hypothetical protein
MPWDARSFAKHNRKLTPRQSGIAARQATAMLKAGVPEGEAIATANKHIDRLRRTGMISPRAYAKVAKARGLDDELDASTA